MTAKPKLAKKHVDRLVRMIAAHDARAAMYQVLYGDVRSDTVRAASMVDVASLRAVLAFVQGVQA